MLRALCAADARFLIVGGYAVTYHGRPRYTKDLDIWVEPSAENAERVFDALRDFGAPLGDVAAADFTQPEIVYQIGLPPNRIDLLTSIAGLEFEAAWPNRVQAHYGDVDVAYLGKGDLIANKRASGRPQDLLDADDLERG